MTARENKNWLEWAVFALGALLVSGIVAYLVYDMLTAPNGPAEVHVELGEAQSRSGQLVVPVRVVNRGYSVAENVHIEVILENERDQRQVGQMQVQLLPRGSMRQGEVVFAGSYDQQVHLHARVAGYAVP